MKSVKFNKIINISLFVEIQLLVMYVYEQGNFGGRIKPSNIFKTAVFFVIFIEASNWSVKSFA